MKNSIFRSFAIILFLYSGFASGQELKWSKTIPIRASTDPDWFLSTGIYNLQTGKDGGIVITGSFFEDTLILGENTKVFRSKQPSATISGPNKVNFIAKYSKEGNIEWAKDLGFDYSILTAENLVGDPLRDGEFAIDSLDNISIGSEFYPMAKLSSEGSFIYKKDSADITSRMVVRAADKYGNTYVASFLYSQTDFDYGPGWYYLSPHKNLCGVGIDICSEIVLGKYDANGKMIWAKKVGQIGDTGPEAIKTDALGNIYLLSIRRGQHIHKFDSNGNLLWEKQIGLGYSDLKKFEIDNSSIYLIEGNDLTKYDLDGNQTLKRNLNIGNRDIELHSFTIHKSKFYVSGNYDSKGFVAEYDLSFNLNKVSFLDFGILNTKIDIDHSGDLILYGHIRNVSGDLDFGPGVSNISAIGLQETYFIAKYSLPKEKPVQHITWLPIGDRTIDEGTIELQATGGPSGNPVIFKMTTIPSTGVAVLEGNIITILGPGKVTVWATQAGNDDYYGAIDLSQTFDIAVVSNLSKAAKEQIIVFPNPSKDAFYLNGNSITNIEITDLQGKSVSYNKEWSNEDFKVSLKMNKSGIYLLKVYSDEKVEYHKITME